MRWILACLAAMQFSTVPAFSEDKKELALEVIGSAHAFTVVCGQSFLDVHRRSDVLEAVGLSAAQQRVRDEIIRQSRAFRQKYDFTNETMRRTFCAEGAKAFGPDGNVAADLVRFY